MLSAFDVAEYFLIIAKGQDKELITNLKLQKLLYYAQGFHLAMFGKPLFKEAIERWTYGPVVPEVYHNYKTCGSGPVECPGKVDLSKFEEETREVLKEVYEARGQYTAWALTQFTHDEPPTRDTPERGEISHSQLKEYFDTQIVQ